MDSTRQLPLPLQVATLFPSRIMAGFKCGLVHHGRHDLLVTTGHTPAARMADHYRIVREHGLQPVRDGLVPGHHALERLMLARQAGVQVIWDLSHYHRNQDPVRCARIASQVAFSANGDDRFWLVAALREGDIPEDAVLA